jgi:hypothetical protein
VAIPKYAQSTPRTQLVKFLCKSSCGKTRYGRVSKALWPSTGPNLDSDLYVTCLRCGGRQHDNYNWIRV